MSVVNIDIDECWTLGSYSTHEAKSAVGELLSRAKYGPDPAAADALARCMGWWARRIPSLSGSGLAHASVVTAVPGNPPRRPYSLPGVLGEACAQRLGLPWDPGLVAKRHPTARVKTAADFDVAAEVLRGAFEVTRNLHGQTVLLVDDVVHTGATLVTVAHALRRAGADRVVGFAATRADRGLAASRAWSRP